MTAILLLGGPTRVIAVRGKPWTFEWHPRCGPVPTNKDGTERLSPWPKPVWDAVQVWIDQGQRVDDSGMCLWNDDEAQVAKEVGNVLKWTSV